MLHREKSGNPGKFRTTQLNPSFFEVARGGERTPILSISLIFSFFTTLLLSYSGSPESLLFTTAAIIVFQAILVVPFSTAKF
jgi:ABC-type tungstate transport system substrate-binding protein